MRPWPLPRLLNDNDTCLKACAEVSTWAEYCEKLWPTYLDELIEGNRLPCCGVAMLAGLWGINVGGINWEKALAYLPGLTNCYTIK